MAEIIIMLPYLLPHNARAAVLGWCVIFSCLLAEAFLVGELGVDVEDGRGFIDDVERHFLLSEPPFGLEIATERVENSDLE